jgi:hypothetical protein
MKGLSQYKILVYDYRNGISVAQRLARDFGTVFYFCPYVTNGFPEHTPFDVGRNVNEIVKVKEWSSVFDEVDMVMFTDSMEPYLQNFMRGLGKPVFGSVFAERLEHDRVFIKETLKELGLPVGNYSMAKGLDELEQLLLNSKEGYVKSTLRGNSETFKHTDWRLTKEQLKKMRYEMGVYENEETYILEQPIDSIIEFGYDGFFTGTDYIDISMCGMEDKDCAYAGRFIYYKLLPEAIRSVNDKLAPIFSAMGYRGHYSNEILLSKDKRGFLIDNTNRFPSPPGELMLEAYKNYSEIVWDIAHGTFPNIEFEHQWGAQIILKSGIAEKDPSPLIVPEEYKSFVKIKNLSIADDGTWYFVPSPNLYMREIGSIVFTANSMDEAMKGAEKIADSIQGFDTYIEPNPFGKIKKSLEKLNRAGISFI